MRGIRGWRSRPRSTWYPYCVSACLAFPAILAPLVGAQVLRLSVSGSAELVVWKSHWLGRLEWLIWAAAVVLSAGALISFADRRKAETALPGELRPPLGAVCLPACLLPITVPVILLQGRVPDAVVSNTLFFLPVVAAVLALERWLAVPAAPPGSGRPGRAFRAVALATLGFAAVGLYFTRAAGPHAGDEGHYLVQAESLFYDGDLDLRNQLTSGVRPDLLAARGPEYFHVSPHSRGGHWYSWHAFGLSLLLAPVVPLGDVARHLVLGLIAGLGCLGMYALCRRVAASERSSLVATGLFSLSLLWGVYSARALPEVLGATLLLWLFWSIAVYPEWPVRAVLVAVASAAYLPWTQTRFLPLAGTGAALFALRILQARQDRRRKLSGLAAFGGLYLVGALIHLIVQSRMFETGLPLRPEHFFLTYPAGAFWSIGGSRGLLYSLPLFAWMLAAQVVWLMRDRDHRFLAASGLAMFVVNALFSTTNAAYFAGATLPGRYHLCAAPLLLPACASLYDGATRIARCLFLFLGLMSTGLLILTVLVLRDLQKAFAAPIEHIGLAWPALRGLFQPYPPDGPWFPMTPGILAGLAFVLVLFIGSFGIIRLPAGRPRVSRAMAGILVGCAVVAHACNGTAPNPAPAAPDRVAARLLALDADQLWFPRRLRPTPTPVFEVSDLFAGRAGRARPLGVTTDQEVPAASGLVVQSRLEANDWLRRGYRWAALVDPFNPGQGTRLLRLEGTVTRGVSPVLAIRQGSHTLIEQTLRVRPDDTVAENVTFATRKRGGDLYVVARLEGGTGTFHVTALRFTPYGARFAEQAALPSH